MAIATGRRKFIAVLGGAALSPVIARAQQPTMPVIGYLHGGSAAAFAQQAAAFRDGLRAGGYVEGQNIAIEYRWADGRFEKLPLLADELVRRHVTVIAAIGGDIVAKAAMNATSAIPIVFMVGQDVVRSGLVASVNLPSGNTTGVTLFVPILVPKQMDLINKIVPATTAIAVLANPNNPTVLPETPELKEAACARGMELLLVNATTSAEIDVAFAAATKQGAGALLIPGDVFFTSRREQIIALAAQHAIPTIYSFREFAAAGGLISYGNNLNETVRLAGSYAARIVGGEKPNDLPVQQPTKFELVINLKTAKALGLELPPTLLAIADEAIE